MAEYDLIDDYLGMLRTQLRWRRDADDVVAEVEDHLYSAVERLEASGTELRLAQRATLERFGAPNLLARSFAATDHGGGLALPTPFTRNAGTAAVFSALLWLAVASAWWLAGAIEPTHELQGKASDILYAVGLIALLGAGGLMLVAIRGLDRRHGGLGLAGGIGMALVGVGIVAGLAAWIYVAWGLLMTGGTLLVAIAMLRREVAPRVPTLAFGLGLAGGAIAWLVLRMSDGNFGASWFARWGRPDWDANLTGITVGVVLLAFGLADLGRWLRSEEPAQIDAPDEVLAA